MVFYYIHDVENNTYIVLNTYVVVTHVDTSTLQLVNPPTDTDPTQLSGGGLAYLGRDIRVCPRLDGRVVNRGEGTYIEADKY